ncbi:MAG: hypothetical protein V3U16_00865 [Candidatus Neomarinimicrobiota bacterium]
MKRIFTLIFLPVLIWSSELDDKIPYDWSGQFGIVIVDGRLLWNHDWSYGPLLYDGSFTADPGRFGEDYQNNFRLEIPGRSSSQPVFADSSQIQSTLNYYRGDYSYDQLELTIDFKNVNRSYRWYGFKRAYEGIYGQYARPDQRRVPLQQSYRFDYISQTDHELFRASVAVHVSDVQLVFNEQDDFKQNEENIIAGFDYNYTFGNWKFIAAGSLHNQRNDFRMLTSISRSILKLNRTNVRTGLSYQMDKSRTLLFELQSSWQNIDQTVLSNSYWSWQRFWSGIKTDLINVGIGGTYASQEDIIPLIFMEIKTADLGALHGNARLYYDGKPRHPLFREVSEGKSFETWLLGDFTAGVARNNYGINSTISYSKNFDGDRVYLESGNHIYSPEEEQQITLSLGGTLNLFKQWGIGGSINHTIGDNSLYNGFGDRAKIEIFGTERLFKGKMEAGFKFWGEGFFNRDTEILFDMMNNVPITIVHDEQNLPDYWVFNFSISAKVSNFIISWTLRNVANATESLVRQVFSELGEEYIWINNSSTFPVLGSFASFRIIWRLQD